MKTPKKLILILIISVLLNVGLSIYLVSKQTTTTTDTPESKASHEFLANRLFSENKNDLFVNFMPLRQALRDYIQKQDEKISLYFEYLPSGSSIGINDTESIEMASLAKLPAVMAVYDKVQKGELSKTTVLTLEEKSKDSRYGDFWKQPIGTKISLEEAVKKTLVQSDNTTYEMIYGLLTLEDKTRMFQGMDIYVELKQDELYSYISAKSYASILKSLYLATYLSLEHSNEVLGYMTEISEDGLIEKGVDSGVKVANKSGTLIQENQIDTRNDCGIVYVPKRPYILCMLVHGEVEQESEQHMQQLSAMIYSYVKQVNLPSPTP